MLRLTSKAAVDSCSIENCSEKIRKTSHLWQGACLIKLKKKKTNFTKETSATDNGLGFLLNYFRTAISENI